MTPKSQPLYPETTISSQQKTLRNLKHLIWLYFWLLLLEATLGKWPVPQLSSPLSIRDPVVLLIYVLAIRTWLFPRNLWVLSLGIIAFFSLIISFLALWPYLSASKIAIVSGFGFSANFLHLPLIFLMPRVLRAEDVKRIGWWTLLLLVPMSFLMVAQFHPAVPYFALAIGFLLWGAVKRGVYKSWLLFMAGGAIVLLFIRILNPFIVVVSNEGVAVLSTRSGNVAEEQSIIARLVSREISGFSEAFSTWSHTPLLGYGLGTGTDAGAKILTGQSTFLLEQGEWARILLESGSFLGLVFVLWRCGLVIHVGSLCLRSAQRGNVLPLLIFSSSFIPLLNGQFSRPTILGFAAFVTGLSLAAQKIENDAYVAGDQASSYQSTEPLV